MAAVYLQSVTRIVGLLTVYFFALMVQSLLERELRRAMESAGLESLPLYPEGRACVRPTARQVLDVFAPLSVHTLLETGSSSRHFHSDLTPLHRQLLKLLRTPTSRLEFQVKQSTRLVNRLHNLMSRVFPELATLQNNLQARWVLRLLEKYPTAECIAKARLTSVTGIPHLPTAKGPQVHQAAAQALSAIGKSGLYSTGRTRRTT